MYVVCCKLFSRGNIPAVLQIDKKKVHPKCSKALFVHVCRFTNKLSTEKKKEICVWLMISLSSQCFLAINHRPSESLSRSRLNGATFCQERLWDEQQSCKSSPPMTSSSIPALSFWYREPIRPLTVSSCTGQLASAPRVHLDGAQTMFVHHLQTESQGDVIYGPGSRGPQKRATSSSWRWQAVVTDLVLSHTTEAPV